MAEKEPEKRTAQKAEPAPEQAPTVQPVNGAPGGGSSTVFKRVKITGPVNERDRDPAAGTVTPTGYTRTNLGGYLLVDQLAVKAGLDPATCAYEYGASEEKRQVALYAVDGKAANAVAVRRDPDRMVSTIYLKPVFKEYPKLAPATRQLCKLYLDVDANGEECLVIALGTGLDKPRRRKSGSGKA